MLIKVPVDVIIESSLVCTLEIPVSYGSVAALQIPTFFSCSVKQVNPTNKDEVDDQVMTCAAFRFAAAPVEFSNLTLNFLIVAVVRSNKRTTSVATYMRTKTCPSSFRQRTRFLLFCAFVAKKLVV